MSPLRVEGRFGTVQNIKDKFFLQSKGQADLLIAQF